MHTKNTMHETGASARVCVAACAPFMSRYRLSHAWPCARTERQAGRRTAAVSPAVQARSAATPLPVAGTSSSSSSSTTASSSGSSSVRNHCQRAYHVTREHRQHARRAESNAEPHLCGASAVHIVVRQPVHGTHQSAPRQTRPLDARGKGTICSIYMWGQAVRTGQ
jgi:hypothetical protein